MLLLRSAAHELLGLDLAGGWKVTEKLERPPQTSGGNYSVGYLVSNADGRVGFLKVIDFFPALAGKQTDGQDQLRELQRLLEAYNNERSILAKCRDGALSHVASAVTEGVVELPGFGVLSSVYYLIFEFADSDVRTDLDRDGGMQIVTVLRTLHHVAVGLQQLHNLQIAHQDVKPSNVLRFRDTSKIGDLGSAADRAQATANDDEPVAGDPGYAPLERLYRLQEPDWFKQRFACDAYLLGSLVFFMFCRASLTGTILSKLASGLHPIVWSGTYREVLPSVRDVFAEVLIAFEQEVASVMPRPADSARRVVSMVKQLCDPDPLFRGHPGNPRGGAAQYDLQRYVTELNLLARRMELERFTRT